MALVLADRIKETTTTTGTGDLSLAGAVTGFDGFSAVGDGQTTFYAIEDIPNGAWEVGLGTYTASSGTLSRDEVFSSSNAGSLVDLLSGTKTVFCTHPASESAVKSDVYESIALNTNLALESTILFGA